jgi:hydrogenase-4 component B
MGGWVTVLYLLILIPLIGALLTALAGERFARWTPVLTSGTLLFMGTKILKGTLKGTTLFYRVPLSGPFTPSLQADFLSAILVVLASFLWFVVAIYAPRYMEHEGKAKLFAVITLLTLAAVMGVFLAGDLITLLLFFELMTIASYFWVVHRWNKEAIRAGYYYLFFSIGGGLLIALAIVLLSTAAEGLLAIGQGPLAPLNPTMLAWGLGLLVAGFGIKGGMAPLHLWLPHAHSAAPTPASALLSGLLIKVGAYGLLRVGQLAGWEGLNSGGWLSQGLILLGIATMITGVMAALLQGDAKRLLAYHSVSQMGYIILGLGVAMYLGSGGSMGFIGAVYHLINHALFKAALFLGVGVIYVHTKETNLYRLGGLWRQFPVTAFLMLLAAFGIAGVPGLNGYASKTMLHHALTFAASDSAWLPWVERLFALVGIGTAASFAKLYYLIFLGKETELQVTKERVSSLQVAMGMLAAVMVGIGLRPEWLANFLEGPTAQMLGIKMVPAFTAMSFWNYSDLSSALITAALGLAVCALGLRSGAFHWHPPRWLTLEGLASGAFGILASGVGFGAEIYNRSLQWVRSLGADLSRYVADQSGGEMALTGIGACAALLILTLTLLIAWYTINNPI